jgi:antitoxin PrlF
MASLFPTTMSTKGQVTIPSEIRQALKLKPGDKINFFLGDHNRVFFYAKNGSLRDLKGMFGKFPRTVSLEEMDEAIARGAAGEPEPEDEAATA